MAVQIYNDNPDGATGPTLNGGETAGPDGGLAVFLAEMPTAGTISGGSVNPNPPTPANSVSRTFGFFLRASRSELPWISPPKIEFLRDVRAAYGATDGTRCAPMGFWTLSPPSPRGPEA